METVENEHLTENNLPEDESLLKETMLVFPDDSVREFEEYLLDIGVRI